MLPARDNLFDDADQHFAASVGGELGGVNEARYTNDENVMPVNEGRVAVIGGGSWGTTLALVAARSGRAVTIWGRDQTVTAAIEADRRHPRRLPGVELPVAVRATGDLAEACAGAVLIVLAVPSQATREVSRRMAPFVGDATLLSAAKGLERGSLKRLTDVIREELPQDAGDQVCALSGPNLAKEIANGKPAASVVAGPALAAGRARDLLTSSQFRCYTNRDLIGVEIGGALKNVIAIGAGIGDGLGAGDNAKAAFLTRGIAEIARLGIALGAEPLTFAGLAGIGDLMATCASPLSRNRQLGHALAEGRGLAEIQAALGEVTEGVTTTEAARELGRRTGVELPITEQVYAVLFEGKPPLDAIADLMRREAKDEMAGMRS